jgi:hypothetical protein
MKNIILFCLFFLLSWVITFAENSEKVKISETDFSANCFEYYSEIPSSNLKKNETFFYTSLYKDPIINQWDYLLTTQYWSAITKKYPYISDFVENYEYINDQNKNTYIELDTSKQKTIVLDFWEFISDKNIHLNFDYTKKFHWVEYQISTDNKKYITIDDHDFSHYWFQYVRINFYKNVKTTIEEKITIRELSFSNTKYQYVIQNLSNETIKIYAENKCKGAFINTSYYSSLSSNIDTKKISSYFEENPSLVANPESDSDNDWTLDKYDNCPIISNPKQQDSNSNGIWDLCADDDNDWIYWDKDNCINTYNPDQADINQNNIWDLCEFDADKDGIFDAIDNCRNIINPEQIDTDKDNIWNVCDNCSIYNPSQLDKNQNWIWDSCEDSEKHLEENDDDLDKIINYKDNCRYIANANQLDTDNDNIWDVCDNCKNIQNNKQIDKNENWIWDMCEDSDNDWIDWYLDNCIHISNANQKDDDNNWIWNLCEDADYDKIIFSDDNCPFVYNPDQSDIDKDNIWDKCDESDERFMESNKTFFIILLLIIVWLFWFGIFSMMKKLK